MSKLEHIRQKFLKQLGRDSNYSFHDEGHVILVLTEKTSSRITFNKEDVEYVISLKGNDKPTNENTIMYNDLNSDGDFFIIFAKAVYDYQE